MDNNKPFLAVQPSHETAYHPSLEVCMVAACSREQLTIRAVRSPIIRISRDIETPRSSCPLTHTRPHGRSSRLDVRDALRFTWLLKRTFLRSAYVDRPQSHNVLVRIECLSALIDRKSTRLNSSHV